MHTPEYHIEAYAEILREKLHDGNNMMSHQDAMRWIFYSDNLQAYYKNAAIQLITTVNANGDFVLVS